MLAGFAITGTPPKVSWSSASKSRAKERPLSPVAAASGRGTGMSSVTDTGTMTSDDFVFLVVVEFMILVVLEFQVWTGDGW